MTQSNAAQPAVTPLQLTATSYGWLGQFRAMASPCEILLGHCDELIARQLCAAAAAEAWRIEAKFSRYRPNSTLSQLNQQTGQWQQLDSETLSLLQFSKQCFELSDGMFDISSGILRKVWQFDGSDRLPSEDAVNALLPLIGFDRVELKASSAFIPLGMELDLGGIAKEYAVDKVGQLLLELSASIELALSLVVNFGGDMLAVRPKPAEDPWRIGIEHPGKPDQSAMLVALCAGALATSGDARRFLLKDGIRYSHILTPKTGWPVQNAPRSVTVSAPSCVMAGLLATTALLQGDGAAEFLKAQGLKHWVID